MRLLRWLDRRSGVAPRLHKALRYVFPEHWSFMLGEIALYCFVVLVLTGTYLALFFEPSVGHEVYRGGYAPLRGAEVTHAYASTVRLSLEVEGGVLVRQTHHWAALVFIAAIVLHLLRVVLTGAYRNPRQLTWYVGLTMLALALAEGFAGYSLPDDLLSGAGLVIAYSVALSIPVFGGLLALVAWGGEFPGSPAFESRLYIFHVLLVPAALAALIGLHLLLVVALHHSQFPGRRRTERNVVGAPLWPNYALRSLSLLLAVGAVLVLLGGLVQINPVWQYGPYHPYAATNGSEPDWYLGWLIGALRLMPRIEPTLFGYTIAPNPFFGGILYPTLVFGLLYLWPTLDRALTGDTRVHNLLDRPRDAPRRTGLAVALVVVVAVPFLAGAADRLAITIGVPYATLIALLRIGVVVLPPVAYLLTRKLAADLAAGKEADATPRAVEAASAPAPGARTRRG